MTTIILPPPNITGALHLGHAYEHTITDALIRRSRARAEDTLWAPGLDHAGIATQNIIERTLGEEGLTRHDIGREAFLARAWKHKEASASTIIAQMQELTTSCDWDELRFTLDPAHQKTTRDAFARLFQAGLISRRTRTIGWCPRCTTALSDIEIEDEACTRCASDIIRKKSLQWFLDTPLLAARARDALTSGELAIDPPEMGDAWQKWCDDIEPWCLSRQLWWGHRIPIWYAPDGTIHALSSDQEPEPDWTQDEDVLDTWFSSALWPLTLGERYPSTILITGRDLLFFWALRMTMLSLFMTDELPFRELHLHGMICDESGRKMSKSFGNTIDPLSITREHGADTLRLSLMAASRRAAVIPFGQSDLDRARALIRKLESIAAYASGQPGWSDATGAVSDHPLDRWLMSRFEAARAGFEESLDALDFSAATTSLTRFMTDDLSDLWIEASKGRSDALPALRCALSGLLALLGTIIPTTSARLGAELGLDLAWPEEGIRDADLEAELNAWRELLSEARGERAARGLTGREPLPGHYDGLLDEEFTRLAHLDGSGSTSESITRGNLQLHLDGRLDAKARTRMTKMLGAQEKILERASARLSNPGFLSRATPEAQEESRRQVRDARAQIEDLTRRLGQ